MNYRQLLSKLGLLLAIVGILCLGGCRLADFRTASAQVPQIVLTTLTDPKTFNPALIQEFPNIGLFCYEGLTKEDGITGDVQPALAQSWEISEDKRRVVFTLRERLKWSDGQLLTADDVVFTYRDVIFNPDVPTDAKDNFKIGEQGTYPTVQKLDDRRIEFRLPEPFAPFLRATSGPEGVAILPRHILEKTVRPLGNNQPLPFTSTWNTGTSPAQIVVNGPYQIEQFISGQRAVFRRNPYYWRKDGQGTALPFVERIIWQFIENTDTQLLRFRSGDLDVFGDVRPLRPEYVSLLKREEKRGKFKIYNGGPWSGTLYMAFNLNRGRNSSGKPFVDPIKSRWFNTQAFRQAVGYGIDRERINNNVFRGLGVIQNSPISVQSPFFLTPEQGLKVYDHNPDKARELLRGAGFKYNDRGELFDAEGNRVRFTLLTNAGNKVREAMGAQIKQDLAAIGIQVDFNPINFNTLLERLNTTRDWDAHIIGFTGGVEPHSAANLWTSSGGSHSFNLKSQPGQPPIAGWQANDWELEIDRLFVEGARELDENKRKAIYAEFQKLVQDQLPVIHLVNDSATMAVRDRVQGVQYSGLPSWGLWNVYDLKVSG
ncbi:MAG: ABC transporter substrate-binding protein [Leptolyngbyaceae cyanobacterium bins.59]|nr:ABC transporter substrate-binding protein [Leptolyngbyaceae cyanobacterium bins.59]